MSSIDLTVDDFDYDLPPDLIAQHPPEPRGSSRLLAVAAQLQDLQFGDLVTRLRPGDLLVFNDTQVIKARLHGRKASGGRIEILVERFVDAHTAWALLRASHLPAAGSVLSIDPTDPTAPLDPTQSAAGTAGSTMTAAAAPTETATVIARAADRFQLRFERPLTDVLERCGSLPLPPYIEHDPNAVDAARYQTVYARHAGAVAAPTAGLHFTESLLNTLDAHGVERVALTLHVGAGTFQPVRATRLHDHRMHAEWYRIDDATAAAVNAARREGRRVVAVGTTALRALEAAAARAVDAGQDTGAASTGPIAAHAADTALFITPGFRFRVVDLLLTNFHLPRSTLLMLVAAFAGLDRIRTAYAHAIAQRYRFFSYGDAMLLERAP